MNPERSLSLRAAALSLLILVVLLGAWHLATAPSGAAASTADDEYAKRMGKASSSAAKTDGLPTLAQMAETTVKHLSAPFYDNGPNDKGIGIQLGHSGRKARTSRPWEGGKPLTEAVFAELSAASGVANDWDAWELVAPSSLPADANAPVPRALTTAEVGEVAQAFGRAAARARAAGFDTVEIHGAHGFLVHEFLSPQANQRTDQYGGSPANRRRFALEVAESVRANWPADLPVFMRLSVDDDAGWSPADSVVLARELKAVGVDVIDCSAGGILARPVSSTPIGYGYQVPFAQTLREQAGIQTMAVGLIVHHEHAEAILQEGRADLIAIGREMLYNPNWALDAARKMGVDVDFSIIPPAGGWWLQKRAAAMPGLLTSTQPAPPLKA
jgi:2,4-dienoyl-CoA reductase-like NADH-dependent reductase (Old Yellow Enzyme family)